MKMQVDRNCNSREYNHRITVKLGKPQTPEIFLEYYCVAWKKPIRLDKLNHKQEHWLVCGFVANSSVLIFAVIGSITINVCEVQWNPDNFKSEGKQETVQVSGGSSYWGWLQNSIFYVKNW